MRRPAVIQICVQSATGSKQEFGELCCEWLCADLQSSKFVSRVWLDQHRTGRIPAGSGEVCTGAAGGSGDPRPTRHGQNHHRGGGDPAGCPQRGQGEVWFLFLNLKHLYVSLWQIFLYEPCHRTQRVNLNSHLFCFNLTSAFFTRCSGAGTGTIQCGSGQPGWATGGAPQTHRSYRAPGSSPAPHRPLRFGRHGCRQRTDLTGCWCSTRPQQSAGGCSVHRALWSCCRATEIQNTVRVEITQCIMVTVCGWRWWWLLLSILYTHTRMSYSHLLHTFILPTFFQALDTKTA